MILFFFAASAFLDSEAVAQVSARAASPKPPAKRIVSLAPSLTEVLFALGLDAEIVGVTNACDFPAAAKRKPKIGDVIQSSSEAIISRRPDLVLAIEELNGTPYLDGLRGLDLPVISFSFSDLDSILSGIRRIGQLTDRSAQAEALVGDIRIRLDRVAQRVARGPTVRVLYVMWHEPLMTIGPSSFIADLVHLAGGRLVDEATPLSYFRLSLETALSADPDVIVIPIETGGPEAQVQRSFWNRWPRLSAVRSGRVHTVDADLLHRPGPRLADGVELLATLFHPEPKSP